MVVFSNYSFMSYGLPGFVFQAQIRLTDTEFRNEEGAIRYSALK